MTSTSNSKALKWRMFVGAAALFAACFLLIPSARADIFAVENVGDQCNGAGSAGGGLCTFNGTKYVPFSLNTLVGGGIGMTFLQSVAPGQGTIDFIVTDDFQNNTGFTFVFTDGIADNASCQLKGGTSIFNGCLITQSVADSHGNTTTSNGTTALDHYFVPAADISFAGTGLLGKTFELEFVSMQNLPTQNETPEPSSFLLLTTGLFGLAGFARRKFNS